MKRCTILIDALAMAGVGLVAYGLQVMGGHAWAALWVGGVTITAAVWAARAVGKGKAK